MCFFNVLAHKLFCPSFIHTGVKIGGIESNSVSVGFQIRTAVDSILIHEQLVGVFPKLALFARTLCRVGGQARGRMDLLWKAGITFVVQRIMMKDHPGICRLFL